MTAAVKQFTEVPNVGDAVGARIVSNVLRCAVRVIGQEPSLGPNLVGIGSIAHWADRNSILWGCGLIADWVELSVAPAKVLAVRGRLTRDALRKRGIPCEDLLGDAGLLLPDVIAPSEKRFDVGIVPHYVDRDSPFLEQCRQQGIPVVDVFASPEDYVASLTACRRILSSSLHGIVFAHAYGIDAAWVRLSDRALGEGFKFYDYYSALGVRAADVQPLLPDCDALGTMIASCWLPDALPDRDALRAALVEGRADLEVTQEQNATA